MTFFEDTHIRLHDVARACGVKPSAVTNWRSRFADFPEPVEEGVRPLLFDAREVEEWLALHDRLPAAARHEGDRHGGVAAQVPERLYVLTSAGDDRRRTALQRFALEALAVLQAHRPDRTASVVARHPVLEHLRNAAGGDAVAELASASGDETPAASAERVRRSLRSRRVDRSHVDDPRLVGLMAALVEPGTRVEDPCCGTGDLLAATARRFAGAEDAVLRGMDLDPHLAAGAECLLVAEGYDGRVDTLDVLGAAAASTAADDAAAVVVANPPLTDLGHGGAAIDPADPRWVFGPPRSPSDVWVQHCVSRLPEGERRGAGVVLVPHTWLGTSSSAGHVRAGLIAGGLVEAVISVPLNAQSTGARAAAILVLRRPATTDEPVLMIDLIDPDRSGRERADLSREVLAEVVSTVAAFRADGTVPRVPGRVAAVDAAALAGGDALAPGLHVREPDADLRRPQKLRRSKPTGNGPASDTGDDGQVQPRSAALEELFGRLDPATLGDLRLAARYADVMVAGVPTPDAPAGAAPPRTLADAQAAGDLAILTGKDVVKAAGKHRTRGTHTGEVVALSVAGRDFGAVEVLDDLTDLPLGTRGLVVLEPRKVTAAFLAAWMSSRPVQAALERLAQGTVRGGRSAPADAVRALPANFPDEATRARISGAWKSFARLSQVVEDLNEGLAYWKLGLVAPFVDAAEEQPG